jgi:hypothetical protein
MRGLDPRIHRLGPGQDKLRPPPFLDALDLAHLRGRKILDRRARFIRERVARLTSTDRVGT